MTIMIFLLHGLVSNPCSDELLCGLVGDPCGDELLRGLVSDPRNDKLLCWKLSKVWSQRQQATSSIDLLFRLLWASAQKYKKGLHTQIRNLNSGCWRLPPDIPLPQNPFPMPPSLKEVRHTAWKLDHPSSLWSCPLHFSVPGIQVTTMIFASFSSHRKHCRTSIWRVRPPMLKLLINSTAPLLSIWSTIGVSTCSPNDSKTCLA